MQAGLGHEESHIAEALLRQFKQSRGGALVTQATRHWRSSQAQAFEQVRKLAQLPPSCPPVVKFPTQGAKAVAHLLCTQLK
jgi:hypothetical protein